MYVSWDKLGTIRPVWQEDKHPVLDIPAAMQKNDTEESIPLHPWFEAVLMETPEGQRKGWAFNPASLQLILRRKTETRRPDAEWVGKVIARIGEAAGIEVEPADDRTGRPTKYTTDAALVVGDDPQALRPGQRPERRRGASVSTCGEGKGGGEEAHRLKCTQLYPKNQGTVGVNEKGPQDVSPCGPKYTQQESNLQPSVP